MALVKLAVNYLYQSQSPASSRDDEAQPENLDWQGIPRKKLEGAAILEEKEAQTLHMPSKEIIKQYLLDNMLNRKETSYFQGIAEPLANLISEKFANADFSSQSIKMTVMLLLADIQRGKVTFNGSCSHDLPPIFDVFSNRIVIDLVNCAKGAAPDRSPADTSVSEKVQIITQNINTLISEKQTFQTWRLSKEKLMGQVTEHIDSGINAASSYEIFSDYQHEFKEKLIQVTKATASLAENLESLDVTKPLSEETRIQLEKLQTEYQKLIGPTLAIQNLFKMKVLQKIT